METVHGFPFFAVEFDKSAQLVAGADDSELLAYAKNTDGLTDVLVLAHGWNNNMEEARALYARFLANFGTQLNQGNVIDPATRRFIVVGVLWPSKRFEKDELISGGAASLALQALPGGAGGAASAAPAGVGPTEAQLVQQLNELRDFLQEPGGGKIDRARKLVPKLESDTAARAEFVELVRSALVECQPQNVRGNDDASERFLRDDAAAIFKELSEPVFEKPQQTNRGGAAGGVTGVGAAPAMPGGGGAAGFAANFFRSARNGARNVLNMTTYYAMKGRAATVGSDGVYPMLRRLTDTRPGLRLHLVGHSFGGRLVAAVAAAGPSGPATLPIRSLSLLQAAFSHNGFATKFDGASDGGFRSVVTDNRVNGPILVTFTANDKAVGMAYPLASRLARQRASKLGDEDDVYGGIGRNGALTKFTPEAERLDLLDVGAKYKFDTSKRIHNLHGPQITDHGDVARPEVTQAVLSAIAIT